MSYGRRVIYSDAAAITAENVADEVRKAFLVHGTNQAEITKLHEIYRGKTDILSKVKEVRESINHKINENRAYEIVNFYNGYLFGEPVQYVRRENAKNNDADDAIAADVNALNSFMFSAGKAACDKRLGEWMLIAGVGYRLTLPNPKWEKDGDEPPFLMYALNPEQTFIIRTQEISRVVSQNFLLRPGKYTLSVTGINKVDGNKDRVYLNAADGSGTIVNYVMVDKPVTFEVASSMVVRSAIVFATGSTYENKVACIQLESGDTATEYEPYKSVQTIETTHTLRGIPVTSGGNYTDENGQQWICDEVDLERGVYVKRVHTENITQVASLNNIADWTEEKSQFTGKLSVNGIVGGTCLVTHGVSGIWFKNHPFYAGVGYPSLCVVGGDRASFGDTVESCNKYLSSLNAVSPIKMTYVMETPIETPLSETEIAAYRTLHSNYPNTTVLNDAGAHMVVKYAADTKLYIDKKIKEALL